MEPKEKTENTEEKQEKTNLNLTDTELDEVAGGMFDATLKIPKPVLNIP